MGRPYLRLLVTAVTAALVPDADMATAGAYVFANEANPRKVAHPPGYVPEVTSSFDVKICVDPTSANAADMEIAMQNIALTFTNRAVTSPNLETANVPALQFDFESVALHELGHCIGLDHTTISSEVDYTISEDGPNDTFDLDAGADAIVGSADDLRGDDINLMWFFKSTTPNPNHPFTVLGTVDSSTYSRLLADLPVGDSFAASSGFTVAAALGFPDTESVMQPGTGSGIAQRTLTADDVTTLRFAMSGLNEIQGDSDDYTFTVSYIGLTTTGCDVIFDFDASVIGLGSCSISGSVHGDHRIITTANATFNPGVTWFFNDVLKVLEPVPALSTRGTAVAVLVLLSLGLLALGRR